MKYISNENMVNFMKSPGSEVWDTSSVNQGDAEYLFAQGVASEITVAEVPAFADMYAFFRDGPLFKVRDGVYNSVPWTWGPIGINTRPDKVPADALTSWEGLFDPKWTGRIGTYDDALNMISVACCATGKDPAVLTTADLNGPVKDWLVRLKPQLKVLSTSIGDQISLLVSGDVDIEVVGLTWFSAQAAAQGATVDFRIPDEGTYGFVDCVFVTPWAPSRANAIAWANAVTQGDTAVALLESVNQLGTVTTVTEKIKDEIFETYSTTKDGVPDAVGQAQVEQELVRGRGLRDDRRVAQGLGRRQSPRLNSDAVTLAVYRPSLLRVGDGVSPQPAARDPRGSMKISRRLEALLLLPLGLFLLVAVVLPAIILFWDSLFVWQFLAPVGGLTVQNYLTAIAEPVNRQVLLNTLLIGVPTTLISVAGGYALAYYTAFGTGRGRGLLFALIVTALMASYLVRIFAWRTLLGENGVINSGLEALGVITQPLEFLLFSRPAAILAEVSLFMPLAALAFYAALAGISPDYREASRDLGAGRGETMWRITLPLTGPAILATTALTFFLSAGDYVTPVLVGGINSSTVGTVIATRMGPAGDYGAGATLSFLVLLGFVLAYAGLRAGLRAGRLLPRVPGMRRTPGVPWLALTCVLLMIFLYAPLAIATLYAFNSGSTLVWPPEGFSLRWFGQVFGDELFRNAFWTSMIAALATAVVASVIGTVRVPRLHAADVADERAPWRPWAGCR